GRVWWGWGWGGVGRGCSSSTGGAAELRARSRLGCVIAETGTRHNTDGMLSTDTDSATISPSDWDGRTSESELVRSSTVLPDTPTIRTMLLSATAAAGTSAV